MDIPCDSPAQNANNEINASNNRNKLQIEFNELRLYSVCYDAAKIKYDHNQRRRLYLS